MQQTPAYQKIERNKIRLVLHDQPFFGCMLGYLKVIELPPGETWYGQVVDTMATNGTVLIYNAEFVMGLPDEELQGVLVHEVLHNCYEHHLRRGNRDPEKWNIATDYVINLEVKKAGLKLPDFGLYDTQYENMTSEEVYARLPSGKGGGGGSGAGKGGSNIGGTFDGVAPHDNVGRDAAMAENRIRISAAAAMAKGRLQGNLPANLQRILDEINEPKIDWAAQFRGLVTSLVKPNYSFSRPNKRYLHQSIYLPGLIPDAVGHIVVAIDTSGSINDEILKAFASEVQGMYDEGIVEKITLIWADASVQHVQVFENGDPLVFEPKGGGGTAFSDTFRWIEENAEEVAMTVYLTDLHVSDFGDEPDHPVVWAVYNTKDYYKQLSANVPFGDCVHVDPD